uniref:Uncharacterized LOC115376118 n=1 Tax=Myripristis murdjan TaxID=586833 RepID=A0A667Z006_9TELE
DLVKNVQCVIHATSLTNCSWQPATPVPDLQFYYWSGGKACEPDYHLEMCSTYVYKDGVKTGCHVPSDDNTVDMYLLFNGTINGTVVKNVFTISMINNVKPPALNWTAIKKGGEFKITWDPVDIKSIRHWCYNLSYTECGEKVTPTLCFPVVKHKPKLFPKIPKVPPNFMDILDNNNERVRVAAHVCTESLNTQGLLKVQSVIPEKEC